jgi:hypothetical protein
MTPACCGYPPTAHRHPDGGECDDRHHDDGAPEVKSEDPQDARFDAPEADVSEQRRPVVGDPPAHVSGSPLQRDRETPEADALEQALEVPFDEEDDRP